MKEENMKKAITLSASVVIGSLLFVYVYPHLAPSDGAPPLPSCHNDRPAESSLASSDNPILRKLAEYEKICQGAVVDKLMTFAAMPKNPTEAIEIADHVAGVLQDFSKHNISPLVVFEPSLIGSVNLSDIHRGVYDEPLTVFYKTLKDRGITDQQMGTWVLFPEANTPLWQTTDPHDFVQNVTRVGSLQKAAFPGSKISILLNSRTYPNHDSSWAHGALKSLHPYLNGLPDNLVDSFGYQGFPSVAEANATHQYQLTNAKDFLPARLATEAARELDIKDVWINTGTFSRIYTDKPEGQVEMSADHREKILQTILNEVDVLRQDPIDLSINLFAEDKSLMQEHIDWSYWPKGSPEKGDDKQVFIKFVHQLRNRNLQLSLYDSF